MTFGYDKEKNKTYTGPSHSNDGGNGRSKPSSSRSSSRSSYIESKRPSSKPRGMTNYRWRNPTLNSFTSSGSSSRGFSSNWGRPGLNYSSDKKSILNNAPKKSVVDNYKISETANPFITDALSLNQKYNTYQRNVANPEYNEYINNQNKKYNKKYSNYRWGNYNWKDLSQNDFQGEQKREGIYQQQNPDNVFGPSQRLNLAQRALFG